MSRFIWLSFPLGVSDPRPPAIPAPMLHPLLTIEHDGASVQTLTLASHTGTHVDTSAHVIDGGLYITEYAPEEFIFTAPVTVDLRIDDEAVVSPRQLEPYKASLQAADIAFFRFGVGEIRRNDPERFCLRSPGFGIEAAQWLRGNCPQLRAIGMDTPSLACIAKLDETMTAHHELLGGDGNRLLIIEDMDLEHDLTTLREVRLNPWLVQEMHSGPCTVVGILHD